MFLLRAFALLVSTSAAKDIGDQDVIYALDIPGRVSELSQIFPDRDFYIYSRKTAASDGVLAPLAIGQSTAASQ